MAPLLARSLHLTIILVLSLMASACQVTMNGETVTPAQLHGARRIAVISVAGNTISFHKNSGFRSTQATADASQWGLDDATAKRFADGIESALGVATVAYIGQRNDAIRKSLYVDKPLLRADRLNWNAVSSDLRAIAADTGSDLVALVVREPSQDELGTGPVVVEGWGYSSGHDECSAYAKLILILFDPSREKPIAGAFVYQLERGKGFQRRIALPEEDCRTGLNGARPAQLERLKHALASIPDDATIRNTARRLIQ